MTSMKNKNLSSERPKRNYKIPEAFISYGIPSVVNGLLRTDPITEAEKLTGESYKTSEATTALGFVMMHQLNRDKNILLKSNEDSVFSMTTIDWKNFISKLGFKDVLRVPFQSEGREEELVLSWLEPGIILRYDTFHGVRNAADVYYAWRPDPDVVEANIIWEFTSTGSGYIDNIWMGSHDAREALRFHLYRLFTYGTFVSPWPKRQFLWFLHHGDTKVEGYNYNEINSERIAMLPKEVAGAIYPEEILI